MIEVTKNGLQARFTDVTWKNMGANKNGWQPVNKAATKVPADLKKGKAAPSPYKAIIEQAKGLETDGNFSAALAKFQEAYELKQVKAVATKIATLTVIVKDTEVEEIMVEAREAMKNKDYDTAIILFNQANEVQVTSEATAGIEAAETALLG